MYSFVKWKDMKENTSFYTLQIKISSKPSYPVVHDYVTKVVESINIHCYANSIHGNGKTRNYNGLQN